MARRAKRSVPYEVFREQWQGRTPRRTSVRIWANFAGDQELEKAWRAFDREEDSEWLHLLASGLQGKPKFCDIDRVVERAHAWNANQNPFACALEEVVDPRVRQLGLDLLAAGWVADGIRLIATNYQAGDEPVILAAIGTLTDRWDLHAVGLDLLRLCDTVANGEILRWICEETPCSFCRESAVRRLIETNQAHRGTPAGMPSGLRTGYACLGGAGACRRSGGPRG